MRRKPAWRDFPSRQFLVVRHDPDVPVFLPTLPTVLGIVVALFFQCMVALLDPINRTRGGIKWGFVVHTVAMFLIFMMTAALDPQARSIFYVDDRNFHGNDEIIPEALGYHWYRPSIEAIGTASNVAFPLNQWLADGLLVSPVSKSIASAFNAHRAFSCIVATLFIR